MAPTVANRRARQLLHPQKHPRGAVSKAKPRTFKFGRHQVTIPCFGQKAVLMYCQPHREFVRATSIFCNGTQSYIFAFTLERLKTSNQKTRELELRWTRLHPRRQGPGDAGRLLCQTGFVVLPGKAPPWMKGAEILLGEDREDGVVHPPVDEEHDNTYVRHGGGRGPTLRQELDRVPVQLLQRLLALNRPDANRDRLPRYEDKIKLRQSRYRQFQHPPGSYYPQYCSRGMLIPTTFIPPPTVFPHPVSYVVMPFWTPAFLSHNMALHFHGLETALAIAALAGCFVLRHIVMTRSGLNTAMFLKEVSGGTVVL
ncbi:hypothetical protein B0H63DRAFT_83826 [Podospora didyma]|uniref:Uncharacterized protein n=1 Tax=Podospora didyma TaxID=330526 RepID=A0AAE0K0X1_9PEZI|nr:hypothetical protein B0H63DRAFT_83826 [Podospora didyma]